MSILVTYVFEEKGKSFEYASPLEVPRIHEVGDVVQLTFDGLPSLNFIIWKNICLPELSIGTHTYGFLVLVRLEPKPAETEVPNFKSD